MSFYKKVSDKGADTRPHEYSRPINHSLRLGKKAAPDGGSANKNQNDKTDDADEDCVTNCLVVGG